MKGILRWHRRLDLSFQHFVNATDHSKYVTILLMQKVLLEGRQKQKAAKSASQARNGICLGNLESVTLCIMEFI